jgi:hypothetical protein
MQCAHGRFQFLCTAQILLGAYVVSNERRGDTSAPKQKERSPRVSHNAMTQTNITPTLADIEADARRLQSQALAAMLRGLSARIRALFGASIQTETGRTA